MTWRTCILNNDYSDEKSFFVGINHPLHFSNGLFKNKYLRSEVDYDALLGRADN